MQTLSTMYCEEEVLERLGYDNIPGIPADVTRLLTVLSDEKTDFATLASTIELYPNIAARLIAVANSAWSSPVNEITSVEAACSRLGFNIVRNISVALAVAAPFDTKRCPGFNSRYFWTTALLTAEAASLISTACSHAEIDMATARAAGMMHNIGLLLLADQLPVEVHESIKLVRKGDYNNLSDALQFMLGFNHCDVGRLLGKNWELPDILVTAMSYQVADEENSHLRYCAAIMWLSTSMVSALQQNQPWAASEELLRNLSLSADETTHIFKLLFKLLEKVEKLAETLFQA